MGLNFGYFGEWGMPENLRSTPLSDRLESRKPRMAIPGITQMKRRLATFHTTALDIAYKLIQYISLP
jgi:hypothetical protein